MANITRGPQSTIIKAQPPVTDVRNGMINLLSGSARHQGSAGRYESLSAAGYQQPNQRDIDSYYLLFDDQKFEASGGPSYRSYGFPVRCLVY